MFKLAPKYYNSQAGCEPHAAEQRWGRVLSSPDSCVNSCCKHITTVAIYLETLIWWTALCLFWSQQQVLRWHHVLFVRGNTGVRLSGLFILLTVRESFIDAKQLHAWSRIFTGVIPGTTFCFAVIHSQGLCCGEKSNQGYIFWMNKVCCVWVSPTLQQLSFSGTVKGVAWHPHTWQ